MLNFFKQDPMMFRVGFLNVSLESEAITVSEDGVYVLQQKHSLSSINHINFNFQSSNSQACDVVSSTPASADPSSIVTVSIFCGAMQYSPLLAVAWNVTQNTKLEVLLNDNSAGVFSNLNFGKNFTTVLGKLPVGSPYKISWVQQPSYMCVVTPPSGSITSDPTQNIAIMSCFDKAYSLSIDTQGLSSGQKVKVSLLGPDGASLSNLDIANDGLQTFSHKLIYQDFFKIVASSNGISCTASVSSAYITEDMTVKLICSDKIYSMQGIVTLPDNYSQNVGIFFNDSTKPVDLYTPLLDTDTKKSSVSFNINNLTDGSSYNIAVAPNPDLVCTSTQAGTINSANNSVSFTCDFSPSKKIFNAIQNGDVDALNVALADLSIIDKRIPLVDSYAQAPTILGKETSVYLYAKYLLQSSNLDLAKKNAIHFSLNKALTQYIANQMSASSCLLTEDNWGLGSACSEGIRFLVKNNEIVSFDGRFTKINSPSAILSKAIGNLIYVEEIYLTQGGIPISGSIPEEIGNMTQLQLLDIEGQNFTGTIPATISNLNKLTFLEIAWTMLSGSIPKEFANLKNLEFLLLMSNQFTGNIPPEIFQNNALALIALSDNHFNGSIPECVNMPNMSEISLDNNNLSGSIPDSLLSLPHLTSLWFSPNPNLSPLTDQQKRNLGIKGIYLEGFVPP